MAPWRVGPAVFLVSAAVLATQVILLRIFSIESFHHFAHMAIGMALLGFGASGTLLVLLERRLRPRLRAWFDVSCVAFPLVLALGVWGSGTIPFQPTQLLYDPGQWVWLALTYLALTAPFFSAAVALGIALMGAGPRVGRIYAWNMIGAGFGSGLALALLALFRPDRALGAVMVVAAVGAAVAIGRREGWRGWVAALLVASSVLCAVTPPWRSAISPFKGLPQVEAFPDAERIAEAWGPTGWAVAVTSTAFRHAPGLSLAFDGSLPQQVALFVDAEMAGGVLRTGAGSGALDFLDWLPSSSAYASGSPDRVLVLGSGGGLEVINARYHGATRITDVELVRPLVDLRASLLFEAVATAAGPAPAVSGPPGAPPAEVRTVVGDARSFVARSRDRFDLVVLPVAGAMPSAAAGVYSLGEDYLNTVDAYRAYLRTLAPGGTLAVTRWIRTPPRDNVRLILTMGAALRADGTTDVGGALAFVRSWATGTLLVKPGGFGPDEVAALRVFARERRFDVDWPPGDSVPSYNAIERPVFREAAEAVAAGHDEADAFAEAYPFRVDPPTDDRPYFGRFLRARAIPDLLTRDRGAWLPFAEWGTLAVIATLMQSTLLAVLLVGLPALSLVRRGRSERIGVQAAYFGALGFGYVCVEMGAIQQLGLLLGHPVYATAATLAALLVFSGIGSAVSDGLASRRGPGVCAGVAGLVTAVAIVLALGADAVSGLPVGLRIGIALVIVALPAVGMGMPFPLGLRGVAGDDVGIAWAWATNGVASVVGTSLAVLVAMEVGGAGLLLGGAGLYLVAAGVFALRSPSHP